MRRNAAAAWLLAGALACSCSGKDVSLGEDRHENPKPIPTPVPGPVAGAGPGPVAGAGPGPAAGAGAGAGPAAGASPGPVPEYPCELEQDGACIDPAEHCSGRIITRAGYECGVGTVCCELLVGGPPPGGAPGAEEPSSGAGGV